MTHQLAQDEEKAAYGATYADHGSVFCLPDGNPLSPSLVSATFKRHVRDSGAGAGAGAGAGTAKPASLKALWSSAVTALHDAGMAIETISKVTGHASTQVTIERYLSVNAERARPEFEVIASRLVRERSDRLTDQQRQTVTQPRGTRDPRQGGDA
jgi:hypothetical protein